MTNPSAAKLAETAQVLIHGAVERALDQTRHDLDRAYAVADGGSELEAVDAVADWRDELAEWLDRHPLPLSVRP